MASRDQSQPLSFLRLPPEIRLSIYDTLIPRTTPGQPQFYFYPRKRGDQRPDIALTQSCRQIRQEASFHFFSRTFVCFDDMKIMWAFLRSRSPVVRQAIKHVRFSYDEASPFCYQAIYALTRCINLKGLEIVFSGAKGARLTVNSTGIALLMSMRGLTSVEFCASLDRVEAIDRVRMINSMTSQAPFEPDKGWIDRFEADMDRYSVERQRQKALDDLAEEVSSGLLPEPMRSVLEAWMSD